MGTFIGLEDEMVTWGSLVIHGQPQPRDALGWATTNIDRRAGTATVKPLRL